MGATSARKPCPVMNPRNSAKKANETTYVAVMWNRLTRHVINAPSTQTTSIGQIALPHWTLSVETTSGASSSMTQIDRFDGFHRCRPRQRITYFDVIAIMLHSA